MIQEEMHEIQNPLSSVVLKRTFYSQHGVDLLRIRNRAVDDGSLNVVPGSGRGGRSWAWPDHGKENYFFRSGVSCLTRGASQCSTRGGGQGPGPTGVGGCA